MMRPARSPLPSDRRWLRSITSRRCCASLRALMRSLAFVMDVTTRQVKGEGEKWFIRLFVTVLGHITMRRPYDTSTSTTYGSTGQMATSITCTGASKYENEKYKAIACNCAHLPYRSTNNRQHAIFDSSPQQLTIGTTRTHDMLFRAPGPSRTRTSITEPWCQVRTGIKYQV